MLLVLRVGLSTMWCNKEDSGEAETADVDEMIAGWLGLRPIASRRTRTKSQVGKLGAAI